MTHYLWIGAIGNKDYLTELVSLGCKQSTGNNVQNKLIQGIESYGITIDTLSGHNVPAYPKSKKILFYRREWHRYNNSLNYDVGFLNLPFLNLFTKGINLKKAAVRWANKYKHDTKTIIVYSLHTPFLIPAQVLKRKFKNTKTILIVPDLPEYMNVKQSRLRTILKRIDRILINKCIRAADGFVLFTDSMKERLLIREKPYIVVEGILEVDKKEYFDRIATINFNPSKKIIMMSGALSKESGIDLLLEAFSRIEDESYELWITGSGNEERLILDYCEKNNRIKYFGYLDSYESLLDLQKKANIFVAMVPPTNPKSRFFFPSKIMEYLITGEPVISFKLDCIPNEYLNHLFFFDNTNIQAITDKIIEVGNLNESIKKDMALKRYELLKMKTKEVQGSKIIDLDQSIIIK